MRNTPQGEAIDGNPAGGGTDDALMVIRGFHPLLTGIRIKTILSWLQLFIISNKAVWTQMMDKECPIPEPFGRMVGNIFFLAGLFFLTFISRFIFAPLMPVIEQELAITHSQAGTFFLMISLGFLIASVMSGFVSSIIKHRGALTLSTLGIALALLAFYLTNSLWAIRGIMLLLGMAAGLHTPSAIATITAMVNRNDWGKALAIHQLAPPLSLILGPLLTVALLGWLSWRTILALLGCVTILVSLAFIRYCPCGDFPGDAPRPALVKEVVSERSFWIMIVLFALAMGGSVGIYAMLPLYLVTERGLDHELGNTLVGLSQISGLFMIFFAGWLTDRIGEKRAIAAALLASGIATIMLGMLSGGWLKLMVFLQPAMLACYFPAGFSALSRIVQPGLRSIAASFGPSISFVLGGGILPAAIGYMGQTYSFGLGITMAGGLIVLGSGLVVFLRLLENMEEGC
ncbi:MFS transporter [Thermodesulfobacteriota bacterium]